MLKKCCLVSGVAPQTSIPLHTMGQERYSWIPGMGVFEMDTKNIVWVLGWRPKHPYLCTLWAKKGVFGYLGWGCLKWTLPNNLVRVLEWRPKHPYVCTPRVRKGVPGYLRWRCLKWKMPKILFGLTGWRLKHPYLCTPWARKVVFGHLEWYGAVLNEQCRKRLFGFCSGAPNTHDFVHHGPEEVFFDT